MKTDLNDMYLELKVFCCSIVFPNSIILHIFFLTFYDEIIFKKLRFSISYKMLGGLYIALK